MTLRTQVSDLIQSGKYTQAELARKIGEIGRAHV